MNKRIAIFLFILVSLSGLSQDVTIVGTAAGQPGKLVRIIDYADQFSKLEQTIAQTQTNISGEFVLQLDIAKTTFAYLALDLEKGEFYLSPAANYKFNIIADTVLSEQSIFDRLPLNFTVVADDDGTQLAIEDFNIAYNDFIYNNIKVIYKSKDKSVVMNFVIDMQRKYATNQPDYVSNYVEYSLASLLWLSNKESNKQILGNYFINKPVLYDNIQYTEFFKEFFKNYFDGEKIYTYEELILGINSPEPNNKVDELLLRDEQLELDNRVREIVEMLLLSRNYHNRDANKDRIISKLINIARISNYDENRIIAENFIVKLQELQNGTMAPSFTLLNSNNDSISLDDFQGKFVLLSFVKEDCNICNFYMQLLDDLKKRNGDKFEIVTIIAGDSTNKLTNFTQKKGYQWPILKSGNKILLLEDYKIRAYPSYIFINPDGTIAYAHLPMPDENMELYLQRFMSRYNNKVK
ncbi:MAG: hypothetical protein CL661_03415 [Bacteroidetes bacterium]|jgi:peroxiredoxin|nr:hypothetical protein [Bacteroidota bacterium]|tara:strand:- start:2289 stop:3686 length:1398 start_codon:yes stop_codon:yes gene_type:complete